MSDLLSNLNHPRHTLSFHLVCVHRVKTLLSFLFSRKSNCSSCFGSGTPAGRQARCFCTSFVSCLIQSTETVTVTITCYNYFIILTHCPSLDLVTYVLYFVLVTSHLKVREGHKPVSCLESGHFVRIDKLPFIPLKQNSCCFSLCWPLTT